VIEAATARAADWHDGAMRRGLAMGAGAYVLWGLSALYWPLLVPAGEDERWSHHLDAS
jgi:chloramphenicol-sensitive protein RarD